MTARPPGDSPPANGESPPAKTGSGQESPSWGKAFDTRWKKLAAALGVALLGAITYLIVTLAYQGTQVDQLKASNATQQDEIALLQEKVNTLQATNNTQAGRLAAAQGSVSELCKVVQSAASSGQFSPPGQVEGICGPVVPTMAVSRPQAGDKVPMLTEASGTADVKALNGRSIWFAVTTPGIAGFFIQGDWPTMSGPATVTTEGKWTSPTIVVGQAGDIGRSFDIVVLLANNSAAGEFWNYLQQGHQTGRFVPMMHLPAGAQEYLRISVVRK